MDCPCEGPQTFPVGFGAAVVESTRVGPVFYVEVEVVGGRRGCRDISGLRGDVGRFADDRYSLGLGVGFREWSSLRAGVWACFWAILAGLGLESAGILVSSAEWRSLSRARSEMVG